MWGKLQANPKTAPLLNDPQFVAQVCILALCKPLSLLNFSQLRMMQSNPQLAGNAFNDPRMISVLGVLMGIDMQGFARDEGSDELPPGLSKTAPSTSSSKPAASSSSKPAPPPEDVKMAEPEEEEDNEETIAKKTALSEKAKGNDSYKKREFDDAIASFTKAWETWPKDITFLTNKAGKLQV